jgi:penicillin-binding protein 2
MMEKYLRGWVRPGRKRWEDWVMYGDFSKRHH